MTQLAKGRPKNRGSIRGRGEKLSKKRPHCHRLPQHGLLAGYRGLCTRIKRLARVADPVYSRYEAKNQCTYTPLPPFVVKYTFTVTFISRDALRLSIVVLFL
jgi:hypothetical protein